MVFFFNDTATTEIYTLSLHDALPILALDDVERAPLAVAVVRVDAGAHDQLALVRLGDVHVDGVGHDHRGVHRLEQLGDQRLDRKSTRLNSSHAISRMPSSA